MTCEEFLSNNFAEIIGLIFIWIILMKENVLDQSSIRKFKQIFYCEAIELVAFNLEKITSGWGYPTISRILLSASAYVLRAMLVYLFVRYVWPHEENKRAQVILAIPMFLCIICAISPFFTDVVYSFNAENHFVRGPLGGIFMVVVIGYVLLFAYFLISQRNEGEKVHTAVLLLVAFFIISATIMSTMYDLEWLGRLSIVYGMVFCLFALDANKLKKTINALRENEELKATMRELEATRLEAENANRAKTEFLLRMSHDIRTPINGITGMLEIAEKYEDNIPKRDECREKIKESSKILLDLVNEVLDMSKLESGEIVLEHISFDLVEVAKEVYYSVKKQADDRDISIIQEDCSVGEARLVGSAVHLKRIMLNILGNAIKYNKDHGKIYITCREYDSDGDHMTFEFRCRDTGIGMAPEFLEHVFEPFTQEDTAARTKYAGTGLGMSIVKKLVDKMGGTITVSSVKDEGTIFDVLLPFEIDHSTVLEQKEQMPEKNYSIQDLKILLVEDNDLNVEIAKFLLEEEGANVTVARNGQEAVEMFGKTAPGEVDAILMDVMMPIMDGYEATKNIRAMDRADAKAIPIIAMTANAFTEDKIASINAGMNDHISKPMDIKLVVKIVANLVVDYRNGD